MPAYKYKGYDEIGKPISGEMQGGSIEEVERRIAAQQITVVSIAPIGGKRVAVEGSSQPKRKGKRPTDTDIAAILRDLAVMAETGVPFMEAMEAVIASAKTETIRSGLDVMKTEIVGGKGLAGSMRAAGLFPSLVSDMVKVAEEGGRLDRALQSGAVYMERSANLRKKVMNAMLYPCVLTAIAIMAIGVLVVFVLPKFAGIFTKMQANVPASTKFLLSASDAVRSNPQYVLIGLIAFVVAMRYTLRSEATRRMISVAMLRMPAVGDLMRKLALSRAFQSIATLLASNVSLMAALEHGAKVAGNPVIEDALMQARRGVEHGASLSESLAQTRVFPQMLIQMVSVGERTGRLGALMTNTASMMEEDVDNRLKALVSIVEPVMIVVMGGIVGTITISIIMPIYSVIENVK